MFVCLSVCVSSRVDIPSKEYIYIYIYCLRVTVMEMLRSPRFAAANTDQNNTVPSLVTSERVTR